jgi:hypothetical protein
VLTIHYTRNEAYRKNGKPFLFNYINQLKIIMEKTQKKATVKFFNGKQIPLEMHKVRIVQSLKLVPVERRQAAISEAGYNSFLLGTKDIFLDMLTDSGIKNAFSPIRLASRTMIKLFLSATLLTSLRFSIEKG